MKKFMFILIGLVAVLSINATIIPPSTTIPPYATTYRVYAEDDYLTLPEERLYETIDYLDDKVEASQEIIYLLIEMGNKHPEFNKDIYDVLFEMDITEHAYDLGIRFFRDEDTEYKAEQDYIELDY